jgi:aspartate racemase
MAGMLGVLGGMGPLASAEFMRTLTLLTPATRDQDHIPTVLWSDPRVPDRTAASGAGEDPWPWLLRGLRGLEAAGCEIVAIPCNTAHLWFERMAGATSLQLLHIVDAAADGLRARGVREGDPVGLLGTAATLASGLYQARLPAHSILVPEPGEMAELVTPAIAAVKANRVAAAHPPLAEAAARLHARGARAVVLGCTEIPLGLAAGPALDFPVVDTVEWLARRAIRVWQEAGCGGRPGAV